LYRAANSHMFCWYLNSWKYMSGLYTSLACIKRPQATIQCDKSRICPLRFFGPIRTLLEVGSSSKPYSSLVFKVGEGSGRISSKSMNSPLAINVSSFSFKGGGMKGLFVSEKLVLFVGLLRMLFTVKSIGSRAMNAGGWNPVIGSVLSFGLSGMTIGRIGLIPFGAMLSAICDLCCCCCC
jgi:hypothetical protein